MKIRLIVPNRSNRPYEEWRPHMCGSQTTRHDRSPVDPIKAYGSRIADIAGGFTATQATGGWKDNQGKLIVESVTVFGIAIADTPDDEGDVTHNGYPASSRIADLRDLAKQIARDLSQTSVYLEIDGIAEFVKP